MTDFFPKQQINFLKSNDFRTDVSDKLFINDNTLSLVLFLDHSAISNKLVKIWTNLSRSVAGMKYYVCDLIEEKEIMQTFNSLSIDEISPYSKFTKHLCPFIILYYEGKPKKMYLGILDEVSLLSWSLKCVSNSNN